jgi:hypothetical protein
MTARTDDRIKVAVPEQARAALQSMRDPDSPTGRAASQLFGESPRSDSAAVALLILAGVEHLQEVVRDAGYEALAAELDTPEGSAQRAVERAHRNRRAAAWADA